MCCLAATEQHTGPQLWNIAYNTTSPIIHHIDIYAKGAPNGAVMRNPKNRKLNNTSIEDKLWHDISPARTVVVMLLRTSTVSVHIQHDEASHWRHNLRLFCFEKRLNKACYESAYAVCDTAHWAIWWHVRYFPETAQITTTERFELIGWGLDCVLLTRSWFVELESSAGKGI